MRISLVALLALFAARAQAQDGAPRDVVVVIAGAGADLESVVRERVTDAGGVPRVSQAASIDVAAALSSSSAGASPALAHVWIDFSSPDRAVILLLDQRFERGLVRYCSKARGTELAREEIGLVLEGAVRALVHGARIGIARAELLENEKVTTPPTVTAPPPPPPRPRRRAPPPPPPPVQLPPPWTARLAATYGVDAYGPNSGAWVTHGPGLTVDVARRVEPGLEIGGRLTMQLRLPDEVRTPPFTFDIEMWSARAQGTVAYGLGTTRRFYLEGALGAGFDVVRVTPKSVTAGAGTLASPSESVFGVVRFAAGIAYARPVRIALWLTLEADLQRVSFTEDETVPLFTPFPVRPGLTLEIGTP